MNARILKTVAKQEGVTIELLEKIDASLWKLLKQTVETGSLQGVMYPTFGKFAVQARNRVIYGNRDDWNPKEASKQEKQERNNRRLDKLVFNTIEVEAYAREDAEGETEQMPDLSAPQYQPKQGEENNSAT